MMFPTALSPMRAPICPTIVPAISVQNSPSAMPENASMRYLFTAYRMRALKPLGFSASCFADTLSVSVTVSSSPITGSWLALLSSAASLSIKSSPSESFLQTVYHISDFNAIDLSIKIYLFYQNGNVPPRQTPKRDIISFIFGRV